MCARAENWSFKRISRRFSQPLITASGEFITRDALVLKLVDGDGRVGFGEVAPWPGFPCETVEAAAGAFYNRIADGAGPDAAGLAATGFPCLAAAVGAARLWATESTGEREVALPCAGLLRDADDHDAARRKADAGYRALKLKIGRARLRDEQRAVAALVKALAAHPEVTLRLDANGALDVGATAAWCDFLSEYPEVAWLEQPMAPGHEAVVRETAEKSDVATRVALDESACSGAHLPADWPGILAVKPALLGDPVAWRVQRAAYPQVAYSSVFETPFGRQAALALAAEDPRGGFPVGFDTLGVFDDTLDVHVAGPVAKTLGRESAFWYALWANL